MRPPGAPPGRSWALGCPRVVAAGLLIARASGLSATPSMQRAAAQPGPSAVKADCFTPYDGMPLVRLTPCSSFMVLRMKLMTQLSGCHDASQRGGLRRSPGGCADGAVVCRPATAERLVKAFGSYARVAAPDAGAHLRAATAVRPGAPASAHGSNKVALAAAGASGEKWLNLEEHTERINAAVGSSQGHATIKEVGKSHQHTPLQLVTFTGEGNATKKKLLLTYGLHAREWISAMAGVLSIESLLQEIQKDSTYLSGLQVQVMPMLNPDGFVHSWTTERLWRKNMRKAEGFDMCNGVDLNRNFSPDWGGFCSSGLTCSDDYHGPSKFSEPESQAIKKVVDDFKPHVHLDFHSHGGLILKSWAYATPVIGSHPPHEADVDRLGKVMLASINGGPHIGRPYEFGGNEIMPPASGALQDYTTEQGGYGYTIELDSGNDGFALPAEKIQLVAGEAFRAVEAAIGWLKAAGHPEPA